MKKKQPQAASQPRRQPATNPKVRLKRSGGSAGDDSGGDAKKVSSLIQPKSPDLAVLDEKKRPRSRNPRSEVAAIDDDAGVDPVRTKGAGSAATAARSAAAAVVEPPVAEKVRKGTKGVPVVEPPVTEKVRKGTKGVRRNAEIPAADEKKPAEEPVVRSLRNRAVVVEVGSSAVQKYGGGPADSTANTRKPENKVSTEVDVGGAESSSPRRSRKRGRSDDSAEAAEEITAVEPTKDAGSDRPVVSKHGKPKIPLPPRRPTRSSAQVEVSAPASDVSADERKAKKQKLDSVPSTKSVPSEALEGKVSAIEEAPRRPTRSAIHEVHVQAFVAKEVSAPEEAPRRSRRSSSIYNPFPVPASVVSGDDEMVDAKKKQPDSSVLAKPVPSEAKKGKASEPEEPPKRSTRSSEHIEVSAPATVVSGPGERAGKKKADSEAEKGKLPVREEPPKRSTRSSPLDVPGGEIPLPESFVNADDKKVVKKNKRGREITPPKASDGKPPVVKELPRRSRRSSIGGVPAEENSLPEEKVVEKKIPGKRVPKQGPKTEAEAAAAPVEVPKVNIPKLEDHPRRAARLSICPVPKHDNSPPQNLGDDNISFNKKEKGKQAKKFQPVEETTGNPAPKVEAISEAEKVHRGKVSEYVKPLRRPTLKKESSGKQAQKQRRARKVSGNSAPTSKAASKTVEVREESQKVVQPEKPPRQTRRTARDLDVSIVRARKSGDDEVPRRGRGLKRQAAEVTLELKEPKENKKQKQSGRWSQKDQSPEADVVAADLSTVVVTDTAATVENDDIPERTVSEMQQSTLPDPFTGDELKEHESCKSQEENLHVGLDVSPDSEFSENQSGQIEVLSIAREVSISEVVVASAVVSQGCPNVEEVADMTKEGASDGDLDFKSNVQCSNAEKEVDSSTMSHVVYVEPTGTPMMTSSCIAPSEMISDEASPAILSQDCSNVAINVDLTREAASDGDLDFKSDIQEAVKEVESHTMPDVVYVEPISTPMMDGSCIAPVETISNEVNVEGNETTYTVIVPLSLPCTKDLPLPEITEANTESENEEPTGPAFTHVAAEISSQLTSCSPVQASCHQEKSIGLLAEPADSNLAGSTEVQAFGEASPVKSDDAKEAIEQASCHQEKSIGTLAEPADSSLEEELCRSEVRAYGEASATPVESEDSKEPVGQASCNQEKSIGLLAESADGNLAEVSCTQAVHGSEVQAFGAALTTMLDAHSPVKSEDAKESIGQTSCHQEKSIDNQVDEALTTMSDPHSPVESEDANESIGQASCQQELSIGNQVDEALTPMSDPHSPVKSEDAKEFIGQASCHQEKSIGNQVDEALTPMSDPHSPVKSEDVKGSIGQASCHQEKSIGLLAESADSNLAELSFTQVVPGSEVPEFGEALPTMLDVHPPVKRDDVKESIGQASCHQEKSIGLLAEPADSNLELSSTQVVFRSDAQEFSEGLPTMLDVHSPVKNDDVKESIGQASCHQEKSIGHLTEPEDGNLAESQDVFRSEVQEFGEALTTMVDVHSPVKSDDAKEVIGHADDVTFAPREVSFGEGIGAEKGTNDDVETGTEVSQTFVQDLASDECSDDQIPNNEPGIFSENTPNGSLNVIDSSSAPEPNLLQAPVEDREPSSSKSFGEGCEIKDIDLEVAEPLNTEVIVDDMDCNSLPQADSLEPREQGDAFTKSEDGFGNVEVTDLESPDCLNIYSVPKSMAGDTSVGELIVANEGDTLPLGVDSKSVEHSETEVVDTQVVDAEPYETASKFVEFTETEGVSTQAIDAEPYESASKVVEYVETEVVDTQVVDVEPYESTSKFVEFTETEGVTTQVVDAEPYESASKVVEYVETEVVDTQVVDEEPYETTSKFVEFTETEVVSTQVVGAEPYESASKVVEYVETEVVDTQDVDEEPYESASKFVEYTETEIRSTQVVNAEPYESASKFVEYTEAEVVSTQVIYAEPSESAISGDGNFTDVIQCEDDGKSENVGTTSGERSTEGAVPLSLSVDGEFDKHTEIQVLSRDVMDAEPYESTIHGIGNSAVVLPNVDGDKQNGVTSTSGSTSFWKPAEDVDVVLGSPGSNINPVAEDKVDATSAEKLSADNRDGPSSLNMDIKFDRNAETQVFSSHVVGTGPDESIDAIQYEGASLSCGASEHGGSSFTDVLPFGDGDKYNEGTQTVGASFFCESAEHSDGNATAVLTPDDGDKCIEGTSNVSASISYGPVEQSANILTEVLPYEGDDKSYEITPTVGASISCGSAERDTKNLTDVLLNEDGNRCNEVTVTVVASLSSGPADDGVGIIIEHDLDNPTDVVPYEGGDNSHGATPADGASVSTGPVDTCLPSRPAEEGVGNIIEQELDNLTDVLPYEGDNKCDEVTVTVDAFSSGPAEDPVGNIINQDLESLPDALPYEGDDKCHETTPTYSASFSSRPAEAGVGNIIDQDLENLPDALSYEGDDKCHETTPAYSASLSSRPAEEGVGNIIDQDLENLPDVLPYEGDDKCNEVAVTVDAFSSGPAEDGIGNIVEQDLNNLADVLPDEGGSECNEATVTVDASLSSRPAEDGVSNINDVLLYEDNDKCNDVIPTVGESISSGPAEHGLENITDVLPFEDGKKYNEVTGTVGASLSYTPIENVDGIYTDVLRYDVGDKSNEGTSTFGAFSCKPVEHDDGNLTDVLPYEEGGKSKEGTSPVGTSEDDVQVTALGSPGGFDSSSVAEAMAGATSEVRLNAEEEVALLSLSVDSEIDEHTETQVLSVQVANAEPYDSTIHGNIEVGDKCDEVTSYVGTSLSEPAEVVEVTAMELTAEEDLGGLKISSDSNAMAFVTSEEELTMQAANAEPHESARLGNNEGDDKCNEVTSYIGTSFSTGPTEAVEVTTVEVTTEAVEPITVEVTTVEVTTVEVTTVEVTTVEVTDVEGPGSKIISDSNVMAGATSEGELNMPVAVAEPSESTTHGDNDNCNEVANYVDAILSSGPAVEAPTLKTSSDLNVMTDATSVGELGMQDADAEPSESAIHGKNDVADKCNDVAIDVGSSFSPRPAEVVEVTAADDPGLEISSDTNVMAGVASEAELSEQVADAEPFESAIHGNSEGGDTHNDVTSPVGTSISTEPAEVVDGIAAEDPGLNISSDSNVTVGAATSTGELTTDSKE